MINLSLLKKIFIGVAIGVAIFSGLYLGAGLVNNQFSARADSVEPNCTNRTVGNNATYNPFPLEYSTPNPRFLPDGTCKDIPLLTHMSENLGSTLPDRNATVGINGLANVKIYYVNGANPTNGASIQNPRAGVEITEVTNDGNPDGRTYRIRGNLTGTNANLASNDARAGGDLTITVPNNARLAYKGRTVRWFPQAIIRKDLQAPTGVNPDDPVADNSVGTVVSNPLFTSFAGYNFPTSQGVTLAYKDANRDAQRDADTPNVLDPGYLNFGYMVFGLTAVPADAPAVTLTKAADKQKTQAGETITYTITYRNTGNVPLSNVVITDPLDSKVTFASATNGGTYANANRTITWNIGNLAVNASATVSYQVTVNQGATGIIQNTAFIDFDGNGDPIPSNRVDIPILQPPVAVNDSTTTPKNTPVNISILTNDYDTDGGTLVPSTVNIVSQPSNGTVRVNADGTNTYTPNQDYVGVDTYTYTVRDNDNLISNVATVTITITDPARPSISLTKATDKNQVRTGEEITYTLTYRNTGNVALNNVVVTDQIDAKTTYVANSCTPANQCQYTDSNKTVTWNVGNVAVNGTANLTFKVRVNTGATGQILNQGYVDFDGNGDPIPSNQVIITIIPDQPNIEITKAADKTRVRTGENITYTVTYKNTGNVALNNVVITDVLDAKLDFVSAANGGTYNQANRTITWNIGTLATNAQATVSFVASVKAGSTGTILNKAFIDFDGNGDPIPSNEVVVIIDNGLAIIKTASASVVNPNDELTYTINYANNTGVEATGVMITDVLDAKLTYVSGCTTETKCTYNEANRTLTWNIGTMAAGATGSVNFKVKVNANVPAGTIPNTASIKSDQNPNPITSTVIVTVPTVNNGLSIAKTANGATFKPGDTITYTVNYANRTGADATNVIITDQLSDKVTYEANSCTPADKCTYDQASKTLTWRLGTLTNNQSGSVTFKVKVNDGVSGEVPNTASIKSDQNPNPITSTVIVNVPARGLTGVLTLTPKVIYVNEGPVAVRVTDIKYADGTIAANVKCVIDLKLNDGSTAQITTTSTAQGVCAATINKEGGVSTTPGFPEATSTGNTAKLTSILGPVTGVANLTDPAGLKATTNTDQYTVIAKAPAGPTQRTGGFELATGLLAGSVLLLAIMYYQNYNMKQGAAFVPGRSKEGTQKE
ncbi:MAG: hypothetical protein OHK0017_10010 [Patescibacteria group bacterium]